MTRGHRRNYTILTDTTDAEWLLIADMLPVAARLGRRREWPMREIVNAIFYVLRGGVAWRLLPKDFPPWQTVYRWFARFRDGCVFERMNHALVMADRQRVGREASPSAAIIDSQSIRDDQARDCCQQRSALSRAFAVTMSLRMMAVMAIFGGFPAPTSFWYFALRSGLKRAATRAGM